MKPVASAWFHLPFPRKRTFIAGKLVQYESLPLFPKPGISLFALWQLKVSSVSFKGERNIVVIQKMKIKKQIPGFA